jgi:hypothetical protein
MFTEPMKGGKTCNFPDHWSSIISKSHGSLNVYFLPDKFQSRKFVYNQILDSKLIFFYFNSVSSNSVISTDHDVSAAATDNFTFTNKNDCRNLKRKTTIGNIN